LFRDEPPFFLGGEEKTGAGGSWVRPGSAHVKRHQYGGIGFSALISLRDANKGTSTWICDEICGR